MTAPSPTRISFLVIETCSAYVPLSTWTVAPGMATVTAWPMVMHGCADVHGLASLPWPWETYTPAGDDAATGAARATAATVATRPTATARTIRRGETRVI